MIIDITLSMTPAELTKSGIKHAAEIGFVLQKNPANQHTKDLSFGQVHCFFSEVADAAEIVSQIHDGARRNDPSYGGSMFGDWWDYDLAPGNLMQIKIVPVINETKIVRGQGRYRTHPLEAFVNDTAFTFGTHTSTALLKLFPKAMGGADLPLAKAHFIHDIVIRNVAIDGPDDFRFLRRFMHAVRGSRKIDDAGNEHGLITARLKGRDIDYPEYTAMFNDLDTLNREDLDEVDKPAVVSLSPCRMDEAWSTDTLKPHGLADLHLCYAGPVGEALSFVYLLGHLLDKAKHYYMGLDEMERFDRFLRPVLDKAKESSDGDIAFANLVEECCERFFPGNRNLAKVALASYRAESSEDVEGEVAPANEGELNLHQRRHLAIIDLIDKCTLGRPFSIVDAGASTGQLVKKLMDWGHKQDASLTAHHPSQAPNIIAMDPMMKNVRILGRKMKKYISAAEYQSSITMRDSRLYGLCDVLLLSEVIEHVPVSKLGDVVDNVHWLTPDLCIVTTPNKAYNKVLHEKYGGSRPMREFRHWDHRWEMEANSDVMTPSMFRDMMMAPPSDGSYATPLFHGCALGWIGDLVEIDGQQQGASFLFVFYTKRLANVYKRESSILNLKPTWQD